LTLAIPAVRLERLAPWLLVAIVLATALWASQPYAVGVFHDDGVYVVLGKALASGEGYRYLNLPGAPSATHYPPGYPFLLAILWKLAPDFPENIALFQLANSGALALAGLGTALYARRSLGWTQPWAIAAALIGTLSYPLIGLAGHVLSETVFVAVLLPVLLLAERVVRIDGRPLDGIVVGAAAGALTLIRTHGVALIAVVVLVLLVRRRWRLAALAAAAAVLVLAPWQLFVAAHDHEIIGPLRGKYASYLPWVIEGFRTGAGFVTATVAANVRELNALLADRFSLSDHALPRLITGIVAGTFGAAGVIRLGFRAPVTALFVAVYLVLLLLWPFTPWRFFYAIWPLVILCVGETIRWLAASRAQSLAAAGSGLVLASVLALGMVRAESRAYRQRSWYQPAQRATNAVSPVVRWVTANTQPDDIVVVEAEQIVYLFTGRRALPPQAFTAAEYVIPQPISVTTESLRRVLAEYPVTVLATTTPHVFRAARLLADSAGAAAGPHLVLLQAFSGGGAFRVERRAQPLPRP
jgi:hypothetical protein